jgi:hypothetical protein
MGSRIVVLGFLLLCAGTSTTSAAVRISDDRGGRIGAYMETFATLRSSGETVIIDGPCLSACTLVLGMLSRNQVCVTPRARLGFHAAWQPGFFGQRNHSDMGTQVLMQIYPPKVRNWLRRKGGLSRRMIYMQGKELSRFFPRCPRARSRR